MFGREPMAIAQAERLREAERTAVFHKIVEKARCSFEQRRKEHLALRSAAPGARLPKLAAHDLNKIEKKAQKRRSFRNELHCRWIEVDVADIIEKLGWDRAPMDIHGRLRGR